MHSSPRSLRRPGSSFSSIPTPTPEQLALIERTRALAATRAQTHVFVNLDPVTYWSLLGQVDALIGNSSSGIMEAASFALPVVNVGMRQQGRERARNIIDAPAEPAAIRAALERALDPTFRASLAGMTILTATEPRPRPSRACWQRSRSRGCWSSSRRRWSAI